MTSDDEETYRDFFSVDSEDGRLGFLGFYGVVGTAMTLILVNGWPLRLLVLAGGAVVGGLMAWRHYGYHHLWLEGDHLVEQTPRRTTRMRLSTVVEVHAPFILKVGYKVKIRDGSNRVITFESLDERTEALRHELGRRLKATNVTAARSIERSPHAMEFMGYR